MKIINPDMPEPYKYETDYRKIPREYLNPRIPRGRGIVKWNAFKTMPQQYEILDQHIEDQNKIDMPLLSDEQLQDINEKVHEKIQKNRVADISYWENGYVYTLQCFINKIDRLEGNMIIKKIDSQGIVKLTLNSIVNVE